VNAVDARARFLRDRVLTATPAQRVVMLYDRLARDLRQAEAAPDTALGHAMQIVAELQASLDVGAGGPAENLASIYAYLLRDLIAVRGGESERLPARARIVDDLRPAWMQAAEQVGPTPAAGAPSTLRTAGWAAVG
jgi:flagellar protein FliS